MSHVTVFGSANWDLFFPVADLPPRDTALFLDTYHQAPGGKGANQAVAARVAGSRVNFFGAMGQDAFAQNFMDTFAKHGINAAHVQRLSDSVTGVASIFVDHKDGTHRVVVGLGANLKARQDEVLDEYISKDSVLVLQGEVPIEESAKLAKRAKANGATTLLNFAPAMQTLPSDMLFDVDYLVLNEHEANAIAKQFALSAGSKVEIARKLTETFNTKTLITLGPDGAIYVDQNEALALPALPIVAVDTIGAGDAAVGFLASALDQKKSLRETLRRAIVAGSLACTKYGAQTGLPSEDEVKARINDVTVRSLDI